MTPRVAPPAPSASDDTGKRIERSLDVLYRRRWIILAAFAFALALAVWRHYASTPVYRASAAVLVDFNRMPTEGEVAAENAGPFIVGNPTIATELFVLQNSTVIAERVDQRLREMHEEDASVPYPARGRVWFTQADRSVNNALLVHSESTSPMEAAFLANAYAEEYVRQTKDASRSYLSASRTFLEQQEARRREELRRAEEELENYLRSTGSIDLGQEGSNVVSRIASMQASRDEARIELQMRQAQLQSVQDELEKIHPQLAQRVASGLDAQLSVLEQNLAELEEQKRTILLYESTRRDGGSSSDRVAAIDRQISELRQEMLGLADQYVEEGIAVGNPIPEQAISYAADLKRRAVQERAEIQGLMARLDITETRLGEYEGELRRLPSQSTDLARLERARQHAEQMYQYVMQRLQETRIEEESEPGYARVLRHASVPYFPIGGSPWRALGIALLLGLGIGVVLAFLRDKLDNRIYKPDDLRLVSRSVLGVIPDMAAFLKQTHGRKVEAVEFEGQRVAPQLVTLVHPVAPASEAYRHLRTSVQFARPDRVVQTLLVTSAAPGDGKSTTAANLAAAMAQAHRRTLLIDADFRRPRQHEIFGRHRVPGLLQLLHSDSNEYRPFVTRITNDLLVMPTGGVMIDPDEQEQAAAAGIKETVTNPSELLGSKRMRDLLTALRDHFDVIIIDTPPVLAATDGVLLATQADATVVVVGAGKTKEGDLQNTLEILHDVGAYVAGAVLNRFDLSMAYGYRYSYGHYTKYGPYSKEYKLPAAAAAKADA